MDTVFALASGRGRAGIAVIRLSGPAAFEAVTKLTDQPLPKIRYAAVREVKSLDRSFLIDEAMVILFQGPHSFTGEDVAEIHLHGGPAIVEALLRNC